jgi:hypothetical protein
MNLKVSLGSGSIWKEDESSGMSFLFNLFHLVGKEHDIFQDKSIPPLVVAGLVSKFSREFIMEKKFQKKRKIMGPT